MKKARDRVLRVQWLDIDKLIVSQYYGEHFPLPRNWEWLRQSFEQHGFKPEYPIVARMTGDKAEILEIVCGVGRYTIAKERGMKRVPVIIRQFDCDTQAQAYAIEDNLFNPAASARISTVHTILLARSLKDLGGTYSARRIWEFAGISESTFWRAVRSLNSTLQEATLILPEIAEMRFLQGVQEIIRRNLFPQFTRLFAGEIEVHTYDKAYGKAKDKYKRRATRNSAIQPPPTEKRRIHRRQDTKAGIDFLEKTQATDNLSNKSSSTTSSTAKTSQRKEDVKEENEPLLFDL